VALACCTYESADLTVPNPDEQLFEAEVYPILLRDCAFYACHGNTDRFLRVFGPGRTRISDKTENYDPATPEEIHHSYERARSMLQGVSDVADSLLLRKPLDSAAGGSGKGHEGTDVWGHNVYKSANDDSYEKLVEWASSRAGKTRDASVRDASTRDAASARDGGSPRDEEEAPP
jgi:hypothetical protein